MESLAHKRGRVNDRRGGRATKNDDDEDEFDHDNFMEQMMAEMSTRQDEEMEAELLRKQ